MVTDFAHLIEFNINFRTKCGTILPYDAVAAIKVGCIHVHGTALSTSATSPSPGQFTQHALGRDTHQVSPSVHTVR